MSQRYSPQATNNTRSHRARGTNNSSSARTALYPPRCIRCETTEALSSFLPASAAHISSSGGGQQQNANRSRTKKQDAQHVNAGAGKTLESDSPHISVTSVCLSRSSISDNDVTLRLLPYLENHILRAPCPLHDRDCGPNRITWINLDLSENHLGDIGICALVNWWLLHLNKLRLRSIKLYKNVIADEGAAALGRLVSAHPWPIEEIHLSHNVLTDIGAEVLLKSFLFVMAPAGVDTVSCPNSLTEPGSRFVYPRFDPIKGVFLPVWVRLEYNHISSCDEVLRRTASTLVEYTRQKQQINNLNTGGPPWSSNSDPNRVACFAERHGSPSMKDPNCSPKRCSKSSQNSAPLFHLYSFSHQLAGNGISPTLQSSPSKSLSPSTVEHVSPSGLTKMSGHSGGGRGGGGNNISMAKSRTSPAGIKEHSIYPRGGGGRPVPASKGGGGGGGGGAGGSLSSNATTSLGGSKGTPPNQEYGGQQNNRGPVKPSTVNAASARPSSRQQPLRRGPPDSGDSRQGLKKRQKSETPLYIFLDGSAFLVMSTLDVALRGESGLSPAATCRQPVYADMNSPSAVASGGGPPSPHDALLFTWRSLLTRCVHMKSPRVRATGDSDQSSATTKPSYMSSQQTPPGETSTVASGGGGGSESTGSLKDVAAAAAASGRNLDTVTSSPPVSAAGADIASSPDMQLIMFHSADAELRSLLPQQPHYVQLALENAEATCIASLSSPRYSLLLRIQDGTLIPNKSSDRGLTSMEAGVAKTEFHLATPIIRMVDSILKFLPSQDDDSSHLLLTESRNLLAFISWLREHRDSMCTSSCAGGGDTATTSSLASNDYSFFPQLYVSYVHPFNRALAALVFGNASSEAVHHKDRFIARPELIDAASIRATFPLIETFMRDAPYGGSGVASSTTDSAIPAAAADPSVRTTSQYIPRDFSSVPVPLEIPSHHSHRKFSVPQSSSSIWGHNRERSIDEVIDGNASAACPPNFNKNSARSRYVFNHPNVPFPLNGSAFSDFGRMSPQDVASSSHYMRPSPSPHARRNRSGASSEVTEGHIHHRIGRAASDVPVCEDVNTGVGVPVPGSVSMKTANCGPMYSHKDWGETSDCLAPSRRQNPLDNWSRTSEEFSTEISGALRDVAQLLHQLEQLKHIILEGPAVSSQGSQVIHQQSTTSLPSTAEDVTDNGGERSDQQSLAAMHVDSCINLGHRMFERWGNLASRFFPADLHEIVGRDAGSTWLGGDGQISSRTTDTYVQAPPYDPLLTAADTADESTPSNSNPRNNCVGPLTRDGRQPAYFTQLVNKLNSLIQGAPGTVTTGPTPGSAQSQPPNAADHYNLI